MSGRGSNPRGWRRHANGVHSRDHLVAGNLRRAVEGADPRPTRMVALVGVTWQSNVGMVFPSI